MVGKRKFLIALISLFIIAGLTYVEKLTTISTAAIVSIVCIYFGVNYKTGQRI